MQKQPVLGQIAQVATPRIHGQPHGVILSIERGIETYPQSQLLIVPESDASTWITIAVGGAPGVMAAGDVTGDGNDDVAIVYSMEGAACPVTIAGQPKHMHCGVVRILDGPSLARGRLAVVAEINMAPNPGGTQACQPSAHPPSAVALHDIDGDGRAELAIGQLGMDEGSCGVVHVFSGDRLQGSVPMTSACAKIQGPPTPPNEKPDSFGVHVALFDSSPSLGFLAVGAPHATAGAPFSGGLVVYDVTEACRDSPPGLPGPATPPDVRRIPGTKPGQVLGADTAFAGGILWVTSVGGIQGFAVPSFDRVADYPVPRAFPLSVAGDVDGDGRPELFAGPYIVTLDGTPILDVGPFATETFRGTILGRDHILSADKFGMRLWSLTDIREPRLVLYPQPKSAFVGDIVNVSVAEMISLAPDPWPLEWQTAGGPVLDYGKTWIHVRATSPGHVVVRAALKNTTALVRVPVEVRDHQVEVLGSDTGQAGERMVARVEAPANAPITWTADGGSPSQGQGPLVETRFSEAGHYMIRVHVVFADGTESTVEHRVQVLSAPPIEISAPAQVVQGERLDMFVNNARTDRAYTWILESQRVGVFNRTGAVVSVPAVGWGPFNVTVVARNAGGTPMEVGSRQVSIENAPPVIQYVHANGEFAALTAVASVEDPGGDEVLVQWLVDGAPVGTGFNLDVPEMKPGWINLTALGTDEGGLSVALERPVRIIDPWVRVEAQEPLRLPGVWNDDGKASSYRGGGNSAIPSPDVVLVGLLVVAAAWAVRAKRRD